METGKTGEIEAKAVLRKDILRDINYLLKKGLVTNTEVYYIVKDFLKSYMKLEYEFTKDELFEELKSIYIPFSIRADFFKFIEKLFMIEYSQVSYDDKELRIFLNEFKSHIDYLLTPSTIDKGAIAGKVLFRNWKRKFSKRFKHSKEETKPEIDLNSEDRLPLQKLDPVMGEHVEMNSLLEKIYYSLYNSDVDSAVELYKQVMVLYGDLSSEDRVNYYEILNSVYGSIQKS